MKIAIIILIIVLMLYLFIVVKNNELKNITIPAEKVQLYNYNEIWADYIIAEDTYLNYTFNYPTTGIYINTSKSISLYGYTGGGNWKIADISAVPDYLLGENYNWELICKNEGIEKKYEFPIYEAYLIRIN